MNAKRSEIGSLIAVGESMRASVLADSPDHGNPTIVIRLAAWPSVERLADLAERAEAGESSFFVLEQGRIEIRWFSGRREVPLCGHGALAVADVLLGLAELPAPLEVANLPGRLWLGRRHEMPYVVMAQQPLFELPIDALDLDVHATQLFDAGRDYLIVLEDERAVRGFVLRQEVVNNERSKLGYIVAANSAGTAVFRFFAPRAGIAEDRASVSVIPALLSRWREPGRTHYRFRQLSGHDIELHAWSLDQRVGVAGRVHRLARAQIACV